MYYHTTMYIVHFQFPLKFFIPAIFPLELFETPLFRGLAVSPRNMRWLKMVEIVIFMEF